MATVDILPVQGKTTNTTKKEHPSGPKTEDKGWRIKIGGERLGRIMESQNTRRSGNNQLPYTYVHFPRVSKKLPVGVESSRPSEQRFPPLGRTRSFGELLDFFFSSSSSNEFKFCPAKDLYEKPLRHFNSLRKTCPIWKNGSFSRMGLGGGSLIVLSVIWNSKQTSPIRWNSRSPFNVASDGTRSAFSRPLVQGIWKDIARPN